MHETSRLSAALALPAGAGLTGRIGVRTVQDAGDFERDALLAGAFGAREEVGMGETVGSECCFQHPDLLLMADDRIPSHAVAQMKVSQPYGSSPVWTILR